MKVLLIQNDLYKNVGGGQTIYQKIIASCPDIEFYYFLNEEKLEALRANNAIPIKMNLGYKKINIINNALFPEYKKTQIMEADRYARMVAGMEFDIADIPDYYTFGSYLRSAFEYNNVKVKRIVLAMHGNISTSIALNWDRRQSNTLEIEENEYEQFVNADAVYSISQSYMTEWKNKYNRDIYYIDPVNFISYERQAFKSGETVPALYCIARSERRKGSDLFIDIVRWLRPESYSKCIHVGNDVEMQGGIKSGYHLRNLALEKGVQLDILSTLNRQQLNNIFSEKALVILPVRYDTLNLVVLEALLSGCPVAISTKAGVCEYLDTQFPQLPYIKIDFDNYAQSISDIQEVLDNYESYRAQLNLELDKLSLPQISNREINQMYEHFLDGSTLETVRYSYVTDYKDLVIIGKHVARTLGLHKLRKLKKYLRVEKKYLIKKIVTHVCGIQNPILIANTYNSFGLLKQQKNISKMSEESIPQLKNKINRLYEVSEYQIDRCTYYDELARLLLKTDDKIFALTYMLRVLRLSGYTDEKKWRIISDLLIELNFKSKLQVIGLYDLQNEHFKNEYFENQFKNNLCKDIAEDYTIYEEKRSGKAKVSVIVSLYNAANKLDFFMSFICKQSMIRDKTAEIIFIDSNSPLNEKEIVDKYIDKVDYVFARSKNRETIQCAWNRGITISKGEYLAFLGVDEMIFPEALQELCLILDNNEQVDWAMGNSLVTQVSMNGVYENSVMTYNRSNSNQRICYLESCYLSYVGGMYRKNIHDRFGYYDEQFRGAGDTEFKNRILPYINVKFVDKTYGVFLDYPEERMTASPMAEIEDLEAWYAHRTHEGIFYALKNSTEAEAEALFLLALNYRKSYCKHWSSDLEYAMNVGGVILEKYKDNTLVKAILPNLIECVQCFNSLEKISNTKDRFVVIKKIRSTLSSLEKLRKVVKEVAEKDLVLEIFNDNRYEQHSWVWRA